MVKDCDGGSVTETWAVDFFVGSATLLAVTLILAPLVTVGAVNIPVLETLPAVAVQVTAVLLVPWTLAVNC